MNTTTTYNRARDAGQEVITITTCSTRAKAESLLARGQWIHAVDRCTFKVQGYAEDGQMITSMTQPQPEVAKLEPVHSPVLCW